MMVSVFRPLVLCLLLLAAAPVAAQETRIAAVVNEDIISVSDLEGRLKLALLASNIEDTPQNRQRISPQVLRSLIDEKLQMQEAKRLNVKVADDELKEALRRIESQNKLPAGGLDAYLKQRGLTQATLEEQVGATIAWGKLVRRRYGQQVIVTEDEINEALAKFKENIGQPLFRIAEIFLAIDDPRQEEEVRRAAERIVEQIRAGAPFPAMAQQFSQAATAGVGGDIGWVQPAQLAPELAQAVQALRPGGISPPIRAGSGFYILLAIDRRSPGQTTEVVTTEGTVHLVQVMFPVAAKPSPQEQERVQRTATTVSQQAKSCDDMRRLGRERSPQTSGDLGKIKMTDLPPDLRQAVSQLEVGQASPPLPLRGGIGVLMVCERDSPRVAAAPPPPLPTREEVADSLNRQKLENIARRYLRDLRRVAFVDVRV
jgi:peptidyl-prolyl cis-trans isomerase SurA